MINSNLFKSQKAVTLLELLVVIVIITILTAILFVNFRNTGSQNLETSVREFVADLRWVQNAAMSGKKQTGVSDLKGYGIHINNDAQSYVIYYKEQSDSTRNYTPGQHPIREAKLKNNVTFQSCALGNCNNKSIFFEPPAPKIYENNSELAADYSIVLRLTKPDGTMVDQQVKISPNGLIQIGS